MSNWNHEGHDRRRGGVVDMLQLNGNLVTQFACLDCRSYGMTSEDISLWPKFTESDYKRHMKWIDPRVCAQTHEEAE